MAEKAFPSIVKAISRTSSSSEGPIILQVEVDSGEVLPIKLSFIAAIQACALLLGDSRIEQAVRPSGEELGSEQN